MSWFLAWFASMDLWKVLGLVGQATFGSRFIIQWLVSEKEGRSVIPVAFWYLSVIGAAITLVYAIHIEEPVFMLPQLAALLIYARNLYFVQREKRAKVGA
jgi:lipid-A-disaccharide synthase-like uncharacterized protein